MGCQRLNGEGGGNIFVEKILLLLLLSFFLPQGPIFWNCIWKSVGVNCLLTIFAVLLYFSIIATGHFCAFKWGQQ